jgi:cobalt-zinc-cadmium efflux system protein
MGEGRADSGDGHHGEAGHDHAHGGLGHVHAPARFGRAFAIGIALNTAFVAVEVVAGLGGGSVALLADAGHNVSDVLALAVAWLAAVVGRRSPSARFTYGLGSSSILAALFNALLLLFAVGALSLEAVQRLLHPAPVEGSLVMVVAAIGVAVNGVTAWLFASGRRDDINLRGAYLHMAADALVSVGVIVAGGLILWTGWTWIDPLASLAINLVIVVGTWGLLRDSFAMSMQAVPPGIEPEAVRQHLIAVPGVSAIHDLHIWPMSTTEVALTCHLTMPEGPPGDAFLHEAANALQERFRIDHVTLQIETNLDGACPLSDGHGAGHRDHEPDAHDHDHHGGRRHADA